MSKYESYEAVIGLEVHIQLHTKSKAYSSDASEYGASPNSCVSPITLGHPGTLPKVNKKVIDQAILLGLACKSSIRRDNHFARKNYFYPDLPKGYQITQDTTPVCNGGHITIRMQQVGEGGQKKTVTKKIGLIRIHMEEDAGKSIHDQDPFNTLIDLNRAGVPLLEMVSEPEIRSSDEAYQYVTEVRKLVRYLGICDGNMEEGSLRCDANISVRPKGSEPFGRRVEVKNMNSIRNVQRAIEHEIKRQIDEIEAGRTIVQDTRSFDAGTGTTFSMRTKEAANDYRYFPEPDLPPVVITEDMIAKVKAQMPPLPEELYEKYTKTMGLSEYDAGVLTDTKEIALYFEKLKQDCNNSKTAANWVMGPVKSYLNENAIEVSQFPVKPEQLAKLIRIVERRKVSYTAAVQKILPELISGNSDDVLSIAEKMNLLQQSDTESLLDYVKQAIAKYPDKVAEYKAGKTGLIGLFMGEVMKLSGKKADPNYASNLLKEMLDKHN